MKRTILAALLVPITPVVFFYLFFELLPNSLAAGQVVSELRGHPETAMYKFFGMSILTALFYVVAIVLGTPVVMYLHACRKNRWLDFVKAGILLGIFVGICWMALAFFEGSPTFDIDIILLPLSFSMVWAIAFWIVGVWRNSYWPNA